MSRQNLLPRTAPFGDGERASLDAVLGTASPTQRAWLAGFLAGLDAAGGQPAAVPAAPPKAAAPLTVVYASESGNSEALAGNVAKLARKQGFKPKVVDFADKGVAGSVTTEDGFVYQGQVLLAADGVHSVVRRRFVGDDPQPTGFTAYRGTIPIEQVDPTVSLDEVVCWMGPGLHLVQYPLRNRTEYNQVAVFRSPGYVRGDVNWGGPEEMLDAFAPMYPFVANAPKALGMARGWPMADRRPLSSWTRGRVALLGDAAHATLQYLAQGAGQSLLDGASLTEHLVPLGNGRWSTEDISKAWAGYEADRVELGGRVQTTSRSWGEIWHQDTTGGVLLRDHTFANHNPYDYRLIDWLYGPVITEQ